MKWLLLTSMLMVMPADPTGNRKHPGPCQPYADKCLNCTDCSACTWCHGKGGTCSVCLEAGHKKVMGRLTVHGSAE